MAMDQPDDFYYIICNVVTEQREALESAKKRAERDYPKLRIISLCSLFRGFQRFPLFGDDVTNDVVEIVWLIHRHCSLGRLVIVSGIRANQCRSRLRLLRLASGRPMACHRVACAARPTTGCRISLSRLCAFADTSLLPDRQYDARLAWRPSTPLLIAPSKPGLSSLDIHAFGRPPGSRP